MSTTADALAPTVLPATGTEPAIPPLENGDRLARPEFERRYEAMPHLKKAELIEGVVYVPSPVSHGKHSRNHAALLAWLTHYWVSTAGVEAGVEGSLRLDLNNEPQPDAYLLILPAHGGQARLDQEGYVVGAPELVAEIAASSVSYDLHDKLEVYRRSGVREYITWRVLDQAIDWRVLRDGRFEQLDLDDAGLYKSKVFPGLWLDPPALLRLDLAAVVQVLQQGLASPEHAAFVARLQKSSAGESAAP